MPFPLRKLAWCLGLALYSLAACGKSVDIVVVKVEEISVDVSGSNSMFVRDSVGLVAVLTGRGSALSGRQVDWSTTDPEVIEVVGEGAEVRARAVGPGNAEVVATSEGQSARVAFAVAVRPQLYAGTHHNCVLSAEGEARCWGLNDHGQLGDGSTDNRNSPVAVQSANRFIALSLGLNHSCGIAAGGMAFCWGDNVQGQLGDGSTSSSLLPVAVNGSRQFFSLGVGRHHSCGLLENGEAWCWGANNEGSVGNGQSGNAVLVPTQVVGGLRFREIRAGRAHTCALTSGNLAYCWGQNTFGQLGNGTFSSSPTPVAVAGTQTFVDVAGGQSHTCGYTSTGDSFCWGYNGFGQLGNGTTSESTGHAEALPVGLAGGSRFSQIGQAGDHTCGLNSDGVAYCWGDNRNGQLGSVTSTTCSTGSGVVVSCGLTPVRVTGAQPMRIVMAGLRHSCSVSTSGEVFCWGSNQFGQLGRGNNTSSMTPVLVEGVDLAF